MLVSIVNSAVISGPPRFKQHKQRNGMSERKFITSQQVEQVTSGISDPWVKCRDGALQTAHIPRAYKTSSINRTRNLKAQASESVMPRFGSVRFSRNFQEPRPEPPNLSSEPDRKHGDPKTHSGI